MEFLGGSAVETIARPAASQIDISMILRGVEQSAWAGLTTRTRTTRAHEKVCESTYERMREANELVRRANVENSTQRSGLRDTPTNPSPFSTFRPGCSSANRPTRCLPQEIDNRSQPDVGLKAEIIDQDIGSYQHVPVDLAVTEVIRGILSRVVSPAVAGSAAQAAVANVNSTPVPRTLMRAAAQSGQLPSSLRRLVESSRRGQGDDASASDHSVNADSYSGQQ